MVGGDIVQHKLFQAWSLHIYIFFFPTEFVLLSTCSTVGLTRTYSNITFFCLFLFIEKKRKAMSRDLNIEYVWRKYSISRTVCFCVCVGVVY